VVLDPTASVGIEGLKELCELHLRAFHPQLAEQARELRVADLPVGVGVGRAKEVEHPRVILCEH